MSYISDYKVGAISYEEYRNECARENNRARYEERELWREKYYPDGEPNEDDEDDEED